MRLCDNCGSSVSYEVTVRVEAESLEGGEDSLELCERCYVELERSVWRLTDSFGEFEAKYESDNQPATNAEAV
jgi:hypothetical protein